MSKEKSDKARPVGEVLRGIFPNGVKVVSDDLADEFERTSAKSKAPATPLHENGFSAIPRPLDDLALEFGKHPEGHRLSRNFSLVLLDLARFTDIKHNDVIITDRTIAERRGVGQAAVKATVKLLRDHKMLRKTQPSPERFVSLQGIPGGFNASRRYLKWSPQSRWKLPTSFEQVKEMVDKWNRYVGKGD